MATPPRTASFFIRKTLTGVLIEGSHTMKIPVGESSMEKISIGKIPIGKSLRSSSKDRQFFFWLNEFKIFDFTFDYFITVSIEFDWVVKKIRNSSFLKNVLRKTSELFCDHLNISCTLQPPIEDHYNRKNFPRASRPTKTLTGVLIGTENWLSWGGEFAVGISVKAVMPPTTCQSHSTERVSRFFCKSLKLFCCKSFGKKCPKKQ